MKIFALSSFLTYSAIAGAALLPAARLRRDVAELALPEPEYLPPAAAIEYLPPPQANEALVAETTPALPAEQELVEVEEPMEDAAVLGEQGYEYRTVRRLKLRQRRDVSHLGQHYLPPHNEYLPPAAPAEPQPEPVAEAEPEPNEDTEEVVAAGVPQPKLANEYLPPVIATPEVETEAPATEAAAPATESTEEEPAARFVDVPQDSAVLLDDGYHYKQPEELPALKEAATEYLPPLSDEAVVVEGPTNGESAVLAADGYHYRAVKRFRF